MLDKYSRVPHNASGALGSQGDLGVVFVIEHVHLLVDDIRVLSERLIEESGALHDWRRHLNHHKVTKNVTTETERTKAITKKRRKEERKREDLFVAIDPGELSEGVAKVAPLERLFAIDVLRSFHCRYQSSAIPATWKHQGEVKGDERRERGK